MGNVLSSGTAVQILSLHGLRVVEAFYYFFHSFLGEWGRGKGLGSGFVPTVFILLCMSAI